MAKRAHGPAVLVVEDDRDTRETLADLLDEVGYTVFTAPDGMSALPRLRTHPTPLIVVLDWWMPGMDGMAVLHALATDAPEARRHVYLLLTGLADEARPRLAAVPAEMSVTLMGKPFDLDDLLAFVERAATHVRQLQDTSRGNMNAR
jgi:CheY-like chemotaxis protein